MGTLADKLNKTYDTKQQIAAAIEEMTGKNPGTVFADYPAAIRSISTGGRGWTGHADVEGLKAIGWTDDDIAYYQEYGVNWNEEDDQYHLVPEDNKALYGIINIDNIQDYKDILVYLPKIDTSGKTDMSQMFYNLCSMVAVPLIDTASATNMSKMFYNCRSLVSVPLFDTSSVTSMVYMFYNCWSLVSVPLFNTHSVTSMTYMFQYCYSLVSVPLFNTSSVTSMGYMFASCYSLVSVPLFNTSSVTSMGYMFQYCYSLVSVPLFNTNSVITMNYMFAGCYSLVSVPPFDTSGVISMDYMFYNCSSLVSVPLFDTSSVVRMNKMVAYCNSLVYCNLKNLKLSIDISATSLLEKSSLLYMIENAAPTDAITITLSAYCYTKFSNDPDVVAALSKQPLVSLASAA